MLELKGRGEKSARGRYNHMSCRVCTDSSKVLGRRTRRSTDLNQIQLKLGEQIRIRGSQLHHTLPPFFSCWRGSSFWAFSGAFAVLSSVSAIWLQPCMALENLSTTWNRGACRQVDTFRIWCLNTAETGRQVHTHLHLLVDVQLVFPHLLPVELPLLLPLQYVFSNQSVILYLLQLFLLPELFSIWFLENGGILWRSVDTQQKTVCLAINHY